MFYDSLRRDFLFASEKKTILSVGLSSSKSDELIAKFTKLPTIHLNKLKILKIINNDSERRNNVSFWKI